MLVIYIEKWPHGDEKHKTLEGLITIANDGEGTIEHGNYVYSLAHAPKYRKKHKEPWKAGKIEHFNRLHATAYHLLRRVLTHAGF